MSVSLGPNRSGYSLDRPFAGPLVWPFCAALSVALAAGAAGAEQYVPYSGIETGTEGQVEIALSVQNLGTAPITCTAQLAHWYSTPLGEAEVGSTIIAVIWHDPADGTLALLNAGQDRMPIEAIWCAPTDAPNEARTRISLPVQAAPLPEGSIIRACRINPAGGLSCAEK
jgi:hypothetical protein